MLSTVSYQAYGGLPVAPPHLFRSPSSCAADLALTVKPGSSRRGGTDSKLRIGNFITFSGAPGIWGPISANSVMLAVAEINRRGGIRGREVELSMYDAGGPIDEVVRRAERAIAYDEIDVIMGSHISAVRLALRKVTAGRIPYVYTPVYEGGERTPGVMAIGETPRAESRPAIHWLTEVKKARRWYL
ncbi:ABC transporter substrate-binding protein, partial [Bradyrhizobium sp.]